MRPPRLARRRRCASGTEDVHSPPAAMHGTDDRCVHTPCQGDGHRPVVVRAATPPPWRPLPRGRTRPRGSGDHERVLAFEVTTRIRNVILRSGWSAAAHSRSSGPVTEAPTIQPQPGPNVCDDRRPPCPLGHGIRRGLSVQGTAACHPPEMDAAARIAWTLGVRTTISSARIRSARCHLSAVAVFRVWVNRQPRGESQRPLSAAIH